MKNNILVISTFLFLLSSCHFYRPELRGGEQFQLEKISGQEVKFTAGAKVYNGNWYAVKVKPSMLDLYVDGELMGKIHLEKKVKMKAKRETDLEAPFVAVLENGALLKAMGLARKNSVQIRLKGKVKGGVFIFSKKFEMDETRTINPQDFR